MTVEITRDLIVKRLGSVKYDRFLFYLIGAGEADAGDGCRPDSDADHGDVDRVFRHPSDTGNDAWPREIRRPTCAFGFDETGTDERKTDVKYNQSNGVRDAKVQDSGGNCRVDIHLALR